MPFGKILWIIADGVHYIYKRSMFEVHGGCRVGCLQTPDLDGTEQIAQVLVLRCAVIAGLRLVTEHLQEFFGDVLKVFDVLHSLLQHLSDASINGTILSMSWRSPLTTVMMFGSRARSCSLVVISRISLYF